MTARGLVALALALAALGCGRPEPVRWSRLENPCPLAPAAEDWETAAPEAVGLDAAALAERGRASRAASSRTCTRCWS